MKDRYGWLGAVCVVTVAVAGVARAEMTITRVWPEKVYCRPGQGNAIEVEVTNPDKAPASARLKVELVHDLDTVAALADEPITVEPGKTVSRKTTWKAQPWLGIEARATLVRDGKPIATRSEFFTCARTVHQVLMVSPASHYLTPGNLDAQIKTFPAQRAAHFRQFYANWYEQFAWAPSDLDNLAPETDRFWSGQTSYNMSKTNMKAIYDEMHRHGVHIATYAKSGGDGPTTYEFCRRHPEYAQYDHAQPVISACDAAYMDYIDALGPPKPGETRMVPGLPADMAKAGYTGAAWFVPFVKGQCLRSDIWYDGANPELVRHHAEQLGKSARMLGFDGVRYDGEFIPHRFARFDGTWNLPADYDKDAENAKWLHDAKRIVWRYKPGYLFGFNMTVNFKWNVKSDNASKGFRERCRDEGLVANELLAFPGDIPWMTYIHIVRYVSDLSRHYGGHHGAYAFKRRGDNLYNYIVHYALRSHQLVGYIGSEPINKFATRMAGFLWGDSVHTWAEAPAELSVAADREVWWKPFAAVRPSPGRGTYFIVHLINAPDGKTTWSKAKTPSAPARDVLVRWTKSRGFKRAMVADLDRLTLEPLEARSAGSEIAIRVPEIKHWSILILEADTPTPAAVYEDRPEDPNVRLLTSEELGIAPVLESDQAWSYRVTASAYGVPAATARIVRDPDAHRGTAVRSIPGGTPYYMATGTYFYPRIPGKYVATFRLKIADNTIGKPVATLVFERNIAKAMPGVKLLNTPAVQVKGTDFTKPNVYQEFKVPFEWSDVGFGGVSVSYTGTGDVWWDDVDLVLVEPWSTERLIEHYAALAPPAGLKLPADGRPHVLLARGAWNRLYRLDDAVARLGGHVDVRHTYFKYDFQAGGTFMGLDLNWQTIFRYNVLVLANVQTRGMNMGQTRMVEKWVEKGGRLVVLGGMMTLGQGGNMQRGWPQFLPVELSLAYEIRRCRAPVRFGKPDRSLGLTPTAWAEPTVVMYRHVVKPRRGATVLLSGTGGEPLLVGRPYGKGRVIVFTGTVLGEPPAGQTAFWRSAAWPDVLAAAMRWDGPGKR